MQAQKLLQLKVDGSSSRLDRFVAEHLPQFSRSTVQRLIQDGEILVEGTARRSGYHLQAGQVISVRVPPPELAAPRGEKIQLDIIFENRDLLVINKPAGMVVHPAVGHETGTLVNAILAHCPNLSIGGEIRPGIVHRLDRDTSGLIVVAKNDTALRELQLQWKSRQVKKTYLALVQGNIQPPRGKIDAPIGRDPKHREKMKVMTRGKTREAVTIYRTLVNLDGQTLIQAEPQTGRTHQIRVHLAFLGYPVLGDQMYGKRDNPLGLTRQFLHAWKIGFDLPRGGKHVQFTAPLPADLLVVLRAVGLDSRMLDKATRTLERAG